MARGQRRSPKDSGAEGVLLVDKPQGPTSHDVIAQLRRALGTRTIGHAGTLDPMATGLLVVVVGRYTRLSQYLTGADKAYLAEVTFGARTTTDDAAGEVVERGDPSSLDEERVRRALGGFLGVQQQIPPAYSAIQIGGERLYDKARRGEAVDVPAREVTIHDVETLEWRPPTVRFVVRCSKGTYIRSLARDLGEAVGVPAHLSSLRRTASGAFTLAEARTLPSLLEEGVAKAALRTGPSSLPELPMVAVDEREAADLLEGRAVRREVARDIASLDDEAEVDRGIAVAHVGERLIAVVHRSRKGLQPARALSSKDAPPESEGLEGREAGQ